MYEKMLAIGMAAVMTISSTSFAFAGQNKPVKSDDNIIDLLVSSGIYDLKEEKRLTDGTKMYSITIDGVDTEITEKEATDGMVYTFDDGLLSNEVILTNSGDIFLDGKRVNVIEEGTEDIRAISPRAYIETWETSSTPYAPGPYNVGGALKASTVDWDKKVNQVTLSALAFVVVTAILGPLEGVAAARGAYNGLAEAYDWLRAADPDATNLWVERRIWTNNKPNTSSNPMEYYSWIEVKYYKNKNSATAIGDGSFYGLQKITNH